MLFSIGIVGLPNVGKSTFFKALTRKSAEIANYPFTTIEPNVGIVQIPDDRLEKIVKVLGSAKAVPAIIEFVDIAGLVKGAHQGEGLGNQFLAHIREVAAICHIARSFENPEAAHIEGTIDPMRDIEIVNSALIIKNTETIPKSPRHI